MFCVSVIKKHAFRTHKHFQKQVQQWTAIALLKIECKESPRVQMKTKNIANVFWRNEFAYVVRQSQ